MTPPPAASGVGINPDPATIQQRIDALLITLRYAADHEKPAIQHRLTALQTALEYVHT